MNDVIVDEAQRFLTERQTDSNQAKKLPDHKLSIPNYQHQTTTHNAVALAYLGRGDAAKQTVTKLRRKNSNFTRTFAKEKLFYLKKQDQIDLYLEGLRLAEVPGVQAA